ncbi:transcriptional regulator [Piscinibacter sakaiensis]|uniref:Transcriptional regulator n=1 Tax=Piscinibacter sakaiensis TaxID=1547922 RepID=A0A0K8NUM0_PISS1|nr:transcriptional regulator [Piscinibacter sakaiensis]
MAPMELKWLDDYVALIETGSFSAAAQRRHVSQPAFSRRIRMLEDWLGVTLIDRSRKPLQLTSVARDNQPAILDLVSRIYEFRAMLKSASLDSGGITIAAQHTLAASYMPEFLALLRRLDPNQSFRIRSENRAESVAMLMRGEAEVLLTYETPALPCHVPAQFALRQALGRDDLVLVAAPALHRRLRRVAEGDPVPMLCFPPESFFGQVLRAEALPALMRRQQVVVRCISEFAMGLRELALGGEGAVWLPTSLIRQDLERGALLRLGSLASPVAMDVVVFFAMLGGGPAERLRREFLLHRGAAAPDASATR